MLYSRGWEVQRAAHCIPAIGVFFCVCGYLLVIVQRLFWVVDVIGRPARLAPTSDVILCQSKHQLTSIMYKSVTIDQTMIGSRALRHEKRVS